ncbi:MAG: spondin domain-containing protein [Gammaproteobacteria bacterium]|nr:spondin domain-containing protein [Gammaproteobacteria bacterium]
MKTKLIAAVLTGLFSSTSFAQDLSISLTNLSHGNHFTPVLVAAHATQQHMYQLGEAASSSLQAMAEGGDISYLSTDFQALAADLVSNPAAGLMAPGQTVQFEMTTRHDNNRLSIVAMILPTNDGFVGVDSLSIPKKRGRYEYFLNGYDAGTEVNDEIINGAGAPGAPGIPADPLGANGSNASGAAQSENNQGVHVHRGVLGDTDVNGGISDLDSRVHRWINPVARLIIEVK